MTSAGGATTVGAGVAFRILIHSIGLFVNERAGFSRSFLFVVTISLTYQSLVNTLEYLMLEIFIKHAVNSKVEEAIREICTE